MNRRRFLATLGGAGAAGVLIDRSDALARGATACQATSFLPLVPLTTPTAGNQFVDARPAFSPDGQTVIFMRGPLATQGEPSSFYTISIDGGEPVLVEPVGVPDNLSFTRPDWSWRRRSFQIAFEGDLPEQDGVAKQANIYLLDAATSQCKLLLQGFPDQHEAYSYPSWYPDGQGLSITNYWDEQSPTTNCSEEPDPQQFLLRCGALGARTTPLTSPRRIWPGMSSVAQSPSWTSPLIAFAGEKPIPDGMYCQNDNQIWIRSPLGGLRQVDGLQGRSPWWSPGGVLIAFESNRCTGGGQNFQIFIQSPFVPALIFPVTDPQQPAQHAKWSPGARKLVLAYKAGANGWGIAYVDLSGHPIAHLL